MAVKVLNHPPSPPPSLLIIYLSHAQSPLFLSPDCDLTCTVGGDNSTHSTVSFSAECWNVESVPVFGTPLPICCPYNWLSVGHQGSNPFQLKKLGCCLFSDNYLSLTLCHLTQTAVKPEWGSNPSPKESLSLEVGHPTINISVLHVVQYHHSNWCF